MSCQSFLAGFMPPLAVRNPLPILWQPIAIHSIPRNADNVRERSQIPQLVVVKSLMEFWIYFLWQILLQENTCPMYEESLSNLLANPPADLQEFYQENAELFKYLTEHSGMVLPKAKSTFTIFQI